jgi:beta-phosphoglucomutase family hydrolase
MKNLSVIFDWDGVVIDSSAQHERSWELLAAETGRTLPDGHFKRGFGKKNFAVISQVLGWSHDPAEIDRLGDRKEELYRGLIRDQGVRVLPGVRDLLAALKAEGVPRAVGSSTPRENIDAIFAVTGLDEFFDAVVSAHDVVHGKPAPDVFLKAATALGADPSDCVVVEDALVGLEAARAAGMTRLAVATTHPLDDLLAHAEAAVASLESVTPATLRTLLVARGD